MNKENLKNISEEILEKIKSRKIKMRSRLRFALTHILLVLGAVVTLALATFLFSFIFFAIRGSEVWHLPFSGGFRGVAFFFVVFPWLIFIIAIIAIIIFEYLVKHFSFSYKKPLIYTAIGALILAVVFSLIVAKAGIHNKLYYSSQYKRLPLFGSMHKNFTSRLSKKAIFGTISEESGRRFTLKLKNGEELEVVTFEGNPFSLGKGLSVGSYVFVAGEKASGTIRAFGVYKVPEDRVRMFIPEDNSEMREKMYREFNF